ncbi:MAG: Y-family DNA polymerase [Bacteroidaceae bacterium]|nr:Y-family DNA polymerase [Bacteroidaceae bacterium]
MVALVDCNSFFCSVEKVFHPGLDGKPVCVLSCNDGCIVALTPEAKALGLRRGDPIFKMRDIVERNGVTVFSTNMYLYAAMSRRVTNILRSCVQRVENYSIDESFCYLDGYESRFDLADYMRSVVEKVRLCTDIPVSVGIAPSKTLAKMGSKFAKNYRGYRSVCVIDSDEKRRKALGLFDLADVWGVGRQTLAKLRYFGVTTPLQFADKKESWVRSRFPLPTVQTWRELNGIPCIDTSERAQKQTICTSRSFGAMVGDFTALRAAVADFAASCANKLRGQHSVATAVTVFVASNRFREDLPQYANGATVRLETPTSDSIEITAAATRALGAIFLPGIHYKRAGVVVSDITDDGSVQQNLFDHVRNRPARRQLMERIDELNHRFGLKTVRLVAEGEQDQAWHPKSEHRSGNYLSDINEILTIRI